MNASGWAHKGTVRDPDSARPPLYTSRKVEWLMESQRLTDVLYFSRQFPRPVDREMVKRTLSMQRSCSEQSRLLDRLVPLMDSYVSDDSLWPGRYFVWVQE